MNQMWSWHYWHGSLLLIPVISGVYHSPSLCEPPPRSTPTRGESCQSPLEDPWWEQARKDAINIQNPLGLTPCTPSFEISHSVGYWRSMCERSQENTNRLYQATIWIIRPQPCLRAELGRTNNWLYYPFQFALWCNALSFPSLSPQLKAIHHIKLVNNKKFIYWLIYE